MADLESQTLQGRAGSKAQDIPRDPGLRSFMLGIYQKMALGLVVTGGMAWAVANSPLINLIYERTAEGIRPTILGYVFAFAPLVLSFLSGTIMRGMNVALMALFYWVFTAVMGVSLSSIFLFYTGVDITSMFFCTAAAFGALSLYGYVTKTNMGAWGSFLTVAVLGIIIASLVNVFLLKSGLLDLGISIICVLVFSALIAYRTQWLKNAYYQLEGSYTGRAAMTYYGALTLYISFINLFLSLLRIFGGGRR